MFYFLEVLWSPGNAFRGMLENRRMVLVLGVILIIDLILALLSIPRFITALDAQMATAPAMVKDSRMLILSVSVAIGAMMNLVVIAFAALLLFFFVRVLGGEAGYGRILGVLGLASAPLIISRILETAQATLLPGKSWMTKYLSLSAFNPWPNSQVAASITKWITIFDLWTLALVVVGFTIVSNLGRKTSVVIAIVVWAGLQIMLIRMRLASGA